MFSQGRLPQALSLVALASIAAAGPCDLYASGSTPCVAAHSTTRALYNSFAGALYQVLRGSDSTTTDIKPLTAGGVANAAAQDTFCSNTTCLISIIYDQSGNANHLTRAPPGGATSGPQTNGYDNLASAIGAPVALNGNKAYGVFISPGTGYRIDATKGVATGNEPEGLYAVFDGTHYNDACCFDYGNAETNNDDDGAGTMEALYFGNCSVWGTGAGPGPWIMADLENNLFSGYNTGANSADASIPDRFTTAIVKGTANLWAIKGGNAASGTLTQFYSGIRPAGYNPMLKQGAIILGIGGDNSDGSQGTFYEGVMTSGYPTDATEASVQANIVAAKYATVSLVSGPTVSVNSYVSLRATTSGYTTDYIYHNGSNVYIGPVSASSSTTLKKQASWKVVTGLGNSACVSFQSVDTPGSYLRHFNFQLVLNANTGNKQFFEDATFCPLTALNSAGTNSVRSWSYPARFFRHYNEVVYIASEGGPETFDALASYNNDASWVVGSAFAS